MSADPMENGGRITEQRACKNRPPLGGPELAALIHHAGCGILVVQKGRVVFANSRLARLLDYAAEQLDAIPAKALLAPEHCAILNVPRRRPREDAPPRSAVMRARSGLRVPVELTVTRTTWQGRPATVLFVWDAQRREAELAHMSRVAAMGEMASGIAHEIAQPLTAIITTSQACHRVVEAGKHTRAGLLGAFKRISEYGERAAEIVRRIKDMASKRPPTRQFFDVNDLVRDVLAFAAADLREHRIRTDFNDGKNLPMPYADPVQIQQVLLNLVRNAIDAMVASANGPRELSIETAAPTRDRISVHVRDTGPGLTDDDLDRIFKPFYTTKSDGLGMGLSISRSIIEVHGGRLWASCVEPRGAAFTFTLPVKQEREG